MSGQSSVNEKVNSSQLVNNGPIALRHVAKKAKWSCLLVFDHRSSTSVKMVYGNKRLNFYYGGEPGRRVDY
ncbi:hypothetical protein KI387_044411, partial [Taxus chinensis]